MKKKYHIVDFIILLVKVIPLPVILTTFFKVLGAILPAYQTIALADFIDIVTQIFQGEKTTSDVFMPLLFILICIIYEKLVPAIENVIHLSAENKLSVTLGEKIVQKRSCLKYQYIENKDMCDLIERVCTEPERRFLDGYPKWNSFCYKNCVFTRYCNSIYTFRRNDYISSMYSFILYRTKNGEKEL